MSKLLPALTAILEKNLEKIITKSMGSSLWNSASKEILRSLLHKETTLEYRKTPEENYSPSRAVYGKPIPKVYGTGKVDGNIIWSLPIKYTQHKVVSTGGKAGKRKEKSSTDCSITLAIAICQGPVHGLSKMWANGIPVNLDELSYRLHPGTENQEPDQTIIEAEEHAPAYRGLAYLVVEEFPLKNYNNALPHFSFEVTAYTAKYLRNHVAQKILEIHTVGQGEWAYDTIIQTCVPTTTVNEKEVPFGEAIKINGKGKISYAIQGLNKLQSTLPNVRWIAVSVHWFASESDIKNCIVKPGTARNTSFKMVSDSWKVGDYTSETAYVIPTANVDQLPGETPSDASLHRYITELKLRSYRVMLVLKIAVVNEYDIKLYCRGSDVEAIGTFFAEQYQPFVEHYCNLVKTNVDAFVIASGFSKLTRIQDAKSASFPAVEELIRVAIYAKVALGQDVVITYAADYNEYHSHNGIYNMDPLWTSYGIDVVGINAYFPLCSPAQHSCGLSVDNVASLWQNSKQEPREDSSTPQQDPKCSWRDIKNWWRKHHTEKDSEKTTAWQPGMKKIWFIEYGFPSISNCLVGTTPHMQQDINADDTVDYTAQKTAIEGTIKAWRSSIAVKKNVFIRLEHNPLRQ